MPHGKVWPVAVLKRHDWFALKWASLPGRSEQAIFEMPPAH